MKKYIFSIVGVIAIAAVIAFVSFRSHDSENAQRENRVEQLPPVISSVRNLEIMNVTVKNPYTRGAVAVISLKNNSPKPIMAVSVESGTPKENSSINLTGYADDPPYIVGKPFQVFIIDFPLSNVTRGMPIRISGVNYADDTEDGEPDTLLRMRKDKENDKKKAKKGGAKV